MTGAVLKVSLDESELMSLVVVLGNQVMTGDRMMSNLPDEHPLKVENEAMRSLHQRLFETMPELGQNFYTEQMVPGTTRPLLRHERN